MKLAAARDGMRYVKAYVRIRERKAVCQEDRVTTDEAIERFNMFVMRPPSDRLAVIAELEKDLDKTPIPSCSTCGGSGKHLERQCRSCVGTGRRVGPRYQPVQTDLALGEEAA